MEGQRVVMRGQRAVMRKLERDWSKAPQGCYGKHRRMYNVRTGSDVYGLLVVQTCDKGC